MNMPDTKLPFFTVISVVFTMQLIIVSGFIAYTTYQTGRMSVFDISEELIRTNVDRIEEHLHGFLDLPHKINDMNSSFVKQNNLGPEKVKLLEDRFLSQIRSFDSVSSIYLGNQEGGLVLSGRETDGDSFYTISTDNFIKGTFRKFNVNDYNETGELLLSVPDFDARTRPWYTAAVKNRGKTWSEVYVLFTGQDMAIAASQPVFNNTGNIIGVLSIDLFLSHLQNFLNRINISKNGEIFIIERSGLLLASSSSEIPIKKDSNNNSNHRLFAGESTEPFIRDTTMKIEAVFGNFSNIIKEEHLNFQINKENLHTHITPITDEYGIDWLIVVVIPERDYMENIWKNNTQLVFILIAAAIFTIFLSLLASTWIVKPVKKLDLSAKKLIEQKWVSKEESYFIREIDSLNSSFNRMAIQLTDTFNELTEEIKERKAVEKNMITLLKEKDVLLQEKNRNMDLYQSLFHQSYTGIHLSTKKDRIIDVNEAFCAMMEYSRKELLNMSVSDLQAPEIKGEKGKIILTEQKIFGNKSFETVNISRTGKRIPVNIQISPISTQDGELYYSIVKDITDQKAYEKSLNVSIKEKEILLKELYHRTKNNMQVISALLNLQLSNTENVEIHRTYAGLSDRIQAMALVHQKLYQSKDLSSINFREYLESLVGHLCQSYSESAERIKIALDIEDISVTLEAAIPCGLIINEVITNALKYAFPDQKKGIITVKLIAGKENTISIIISDNGIGIDPEIDTIKPKTLGLQLIQTIAEHQLYGGIKYKVNKGTEWTLVFNKNISSPRV